MISLKIMAARLRVMQADRRVTNRVLSADLDVPYKAVSAWRSEGIKNTGTFFRVCEYFDVTPDEFLGLKDDQYE